MKKSKKGYLRQGSTMLIFIGYFSRRETSIVLQNTLLLIVYLEIYPYIKKSEFTKSYDVTNV